MRLQRFLGEYYKPLDALNFLKEFNVESDFMDYVSSDEDASTRPEPTDEVYIFDSVSNYSIFNL